MSSDQPTSHPVIFSLPKSGTVYVQRSFEATLKAVHVRITGRAGNMRDDIITEQLFKFKEQPCAVVVEHVPANDRNLILLGAVGIDRVAVMIRDPRDAIVSWWRHLERDNIKGTPWIVAHLYASGLMSQHYYSLPMDARFLDLVEHMFPVMQSWLSRWLAAIEQPAGIGFHLLRYEDFVADTRGSLRSLYRFFGHEVEPTLPPKEGRPEQMQAGIHTATHFRRGVPGSHRDEVPAAHVALLNERVDQALFERSGWAFP